MEEREGSRREKTGREEMKGVEKRRVIGKEEGGE